VTKQKYTFPKRFLWGASTSSHQVEGGNYNQWSEWEDTNALSLSKKAIYRLDETPVWDDIKSQAIERDNYISGKAVDHYNRYEKDFDILNQLNMNSYRFSIEWSRLEPREGEWDQKEIDHYHRYFEALKKRKITPVVTLFHWTTPVWFAEKGGFERKANVDYFVRFARKVFAEYGAHLRLVCTLNEPEIYVGKGWLDEDAWPPAKHGSRIGAIKTSLNLISAHKQVFAAARSSSRRIKIGIANNVSNYYAADDSLKTKSAMKLKRYISDDLFVDRIKKHVDWIGVNYYFSNKYLNGKEQNENKRVNDLGWEMLPDNIEHVIMRQWQRYKKPIIITENGVADQGDQYRKWWIAHTIDAIHSAMKRGARVEGYLHWSLLDNFEWSYGKWPRFGLVAVDYKTMERTIRPSAAWFGKVVGNLRKG